MGGGRTAKKKKKQLSLEGKDDDASEIHNTT